MSEYEKDTAFLKQCLHYDNSPERQQLQEGMARIQRDQRCVRRAVWLMALLTALSAVGLVYTAVFLMDSSQDMKQFLTTFIPQVLCALGVGSFLCLLAFLGLGILYRGELNRQRERCRRLAARLFESSLGQTCILPLPGAGQPANINEPIAGSNSG
jgi:hypothetical protein